MLVFLFTDIEGSTRLWEEYTAEMGAVIARHDEILREQIESHGGRITKHTGDGITAVFEAGQPLDCALEAQKQFSAEPWAAIAELRIRVGAHAGEAEYHASAGTLEGDYFGPPVNATARIMSAAWGGQILLTPEVTQSSPLPAQATLLDLGEHLLKNVSAPQKLYQLVHPDLSRQDFPPPRTLSGQSIHQAVGQQGEQIAGMEPMAMAVGLLTATLLPALQGRLDPQSGALEGNLGVLGDLGAATLRDFTAQFAAQLQARQQAGETLPAPEVQSLLHGELQARWQAGGETAIALRSDTSRLLQAVHGVQAAMTAANDEVREALAQGLAGLGSQFGEFRWMLAGVQDTLAEMRVRQALQLGLQREQLDLQRQQLVKTNLILQRHKERAPAQIPVPVAWPEEDLPPADVPCPYMGLVAFEAEDAQYFFGREELVAELTARLAGTRFLAVVGPSGSGKSSLVRAGLLPSVWAGALPGSEDWQTMVITPGARPLDELAVRLSVLSDDRPAALLRDLEADHRVLDLTIRRALAGQPAGVKLLLVVDQFEEIFALCRDKEERRTFINALLYAVEAEEGRTIVVPTIRADFYGRCAAYPQLAARLSDGLLVGPLSEEDLRAAIERPAALVGLQLEPGLTGMILDDVAGEPGALPLLSHALLETFERRRGSQLTLSGYAGSGGVAGAIAQTADTVYGGLEPEQQALARSIFLRLTELGAEGTQDTRRRVAPAELQRSEEEAPAVASLLRTLAAARLVTTGDDTVEVAHEALIREWPALRGWLDEDREGLRIHRHLTVAAGEWQRLEQDPGELYRGARLAAAGEWAEEHDQELNPLEREFLAASKESAWRREAEREAQSQRELEAARQLAEAERQRAEERAGSAARLRRRAILLALALVVALIAAAAAGLLWNQSSDLAVEKADIASTAQAASTRAIAEGAAAQTAQAQEAAQRATAQVASTQAVSERAVAQTAQAMEAEQKAAAQAEAHARATAEAVALLEREEALRQASIGLAAEAELQLMGPRPERAALLALEAVENYPYTWQAEKALSQAVFENRLLLDLHHEGYANHASVSPDGTRIATASDDHTARVWDLATGEELLTLEGHGNWVNRVFWSPAGDRLLTASTDGTAKVWDGTTGSELYTLEGHEGYYAEWSPDGRLILTYRETADDVATLWDAATGERLHALTGHDGRVTSFNGWSPDGEQVATSSRDGTAKVWDAATGTELLTLSGHDGTVFRAEFSPDASSIATSSFDGTAKVWDAASGELLLTLPGHTGSPRARWSPSGDRLLTVSTGLARVWDAESGELLHLLPSQGELYAVWSPDGSLIATGGSGGEIKVWDSVTGAELLDFQGHPLDIGEMGWFPSGDRIWTVSGDGSAKVWQVSQAILSLGCQPSCPPAPWGGWYSNAAWSPSGEQVAAGYADGSVRILGRRYRRRTGRVADPDGGKLRTRWDHLDRVDASRRSYPCRGRRRQCHGMGCGFRPATPQALRSRGCAHGRALVARCVAHRDLRPGWRGQGMGHRQRRAACHLHRAQSLVGGLVTRRDAHRHRRPARRQQQHQGLGCGQRRGAARPLPR